ncbi:MAG TPA: lipocalin-like domain-containing protein [Candidatus Dormibacteraeota bacterium]|nr:lipocalin-like domain-containing protein [Candidatus Dormibacteraeota bacterium]
MIASLLACVLYIVPLNAQTPSQTSFETATPGYHYVFPRDHFNHQNYQTEWWYYTGNVVDADGKHFGFELTFFRQAANREKEKTKIWDIQDLYLAHLALSDIDGGKFYHAERLNRQGPEVAGACEAEQKVWNGNWQVRWNGADQQLQAVDKDFTLDLNLHPEKPPVIQGENGISQKSAGDGHASHYISLTRLNTTGKIRLQGQTFQVSGLTWMDHEFFTTQLDTSQQGWDWLAIQLNDGTELMLYHFRHKDGSQDPFSSGTYIDNSGKTTHLRANDFTLQPSGDEWKSPETGATYPISWKIQVPQLAISLEAKTRLPSQELATRSNLAPSYWEGAIILNGTRGTHALDGLGYLELTGYSGNHPLKLTY